MTTDTLHDYDRLVDTGFSDEQARTLVELLATSSETRPEVAGTLQLILGRLDRQDEVLQAIFNGHGEAIGQLRGDLHVIDERLQSETRIQRMLNTTLIAISALLGSLLAVFAR